MIAIADWSYHYFRICLVKGLSITCVAPQIKRGTLNSSTPVETAFNIFGCLWADIIMVEEGNSVWI
ncbi:MAG: hypothetical protein CMF69_02160 [Magnetovibrio sp.]|nr:hypothetical protein [Magnetovibrio sp.]